MLEDVPQLLRSCWWLGTGCSGTLSSCARVALTVGPRLGEQHTVAVTQLQLRVTPRHARKEVLQCKPRWLLLGAEAGEALPWVELPSAQFSHWELKGRTNIPGKLLNQRCQVMMSGTGGTRPHEQLSGRSCHSPKPLPHPWRGCPALGISSCSTQALPRLPMGWDACVG